MVRIIHISIYDAVTCNERNLQRKKNKILSTLNIVHYYHESIPINMNHTLNAKGGKFDSKAIDFRNIPC